VKLPLDEAVKQALALMEKPNVDVYYKKQAYTLHPTPYTLQSTPFNLHPTPYILHPAPCTPNSAP